MGCACACVCMAVCDLIVGDSVAACARLLVQGGHFVLESLSLFQAVASCTTLRGGGVGMSIALRLGGHCDR